MCLAGPWSRNEYGLRWDVADASDASMGAPTEREASAVVSDRVLDAS